MFSPPLRRSSPFFLSLFIFLLLSLAFLPPPASAAQTVVESGELLCLREVVPPQSSVAFQFHVVAGGDRAVRVTLEDQDGRSLARWEGETEGVHKVTWREGTRAVTACIDNTHARFATKWVEFYFRHHVDYAAVARQEKLDPVEHAIGGISDTMGVLEGLQVQLRAQQKEHRATVKESNDRLFMWCVFQLASLLVMSLVQLYFLKRFLQRKSFV